MRTLPLLLGLLACTPPPRPLADPEGEFAVDALSPNFGPVDGGTEVTITGHGFEGNVRVRFEAVYLPVNVIDSETLTFETPAASAPTFVEVGVSSDLGTVTLPDAFEYTDDTGRDTGDTGRDTGGVSGVGGVVQYTLTQIACPDCWGLTSSLDVVAQAAFHEPVSGSWTNWLPASGTCSTNAGPTAPTGVTRSVGSWVYLNSGSVSIGLRESSGTTGPQYTSNGLSEADYPRNASFDLSAPDVGLTATGVLRTPQSITSLTPTSLLNNDLNTAFAPSVSWAGHTFTWGPSGGGDPFVILIDGYSGTSGTYLGSVLCVGPDNGALTVPGAYLQQFPYDTLLGVGMYRYALSSAEASDGRTIESVAQFGVLGNASFY
ncbi:MAG: hypothetical protein EP330_31220 [Deltaproteobacteria bacterium]|nr:MAG: hypothetical protein EP330_31220 [Deltaproteobacteria bacterium]